MPLAIGYLCWLAVCWGFVQLCSSPCWALGLSHYFISGRSLPQFRTANIWSLLLSSPLAIFWLALGLVVMVFLGMIIEKVPVFGQFVFFKALIWGVISIALYRLWMGRSHAALVLRAILMVSFSGIIVGAVAYAYWWIIAQTPLFLIVCLSTIGALNVAFYSSSVRLTALKDNLIEPQGA